MNLFSISRFISAALICMAVIGCSPAAAPKLERYTFGRTYLSGSNDSPRGGSTTGLKVTLAPTESERWTALQEPNLTVLERDRRAILAMTGDYKATFEFIETIPFAADYKMDRPYLSWATERVYVLKNEKHFISLQHIMVMYFVEREKGEKEKVIGPIVIKHWRQDWSYEPKAFHEYIGNSTWKRRSTTKQERTGAWSQEVFHVDDAPRYASVGRWKHTAQFSEWTGNQTFRPLPRREYSVRSDYHVLDAVNRHIILPRGWVHEQINLKRALNKGSADTFIAREIGLNRYERIVDQDFSAGDLYWQKSKKYWKEVRKVWRSVFKTKEQFVFRGKIDEHSLIEKHFRFVDQISTTMDSAKLLEKAESFILPHLTSSPKM